MDLHILGIALPSSEEDSGDSSCRYEAGSLGITRTCPGHAGLMSRNEYTYSLSNILKQGISPSIILVKIDFYSLILLPR